MIWEYQSLREALPAPQFYGRHGQIKVSVWEGGDVETDDIVVVRRAIGEWDRAASEDRNKAIVSSSKQALQIFLGPGGVRMKERVYYLY